MLLSCKINSIVNFNSGLSPLKNLAWHCLHWTWSLLKRLLEMNRYADFVERIFSVGPLIFFFFLVWLGECRTIKTNYVTIFITCRLMPFSWLTNLERSL